MDEDRIQWSTPRNSVPVYLRFGKWGRRPRSINFSTGKIEKGLSVYRAEVSAPGVARLADDIGLILDAHDCADALNGRLVFAVTGRETAIGSDGEPVIVGVKLLPYAIEYATLPAAYKNEKKGEY